MQREREVRAMVVWSDIGDHPLIRDIRQNPYFALRAPSRRLGELIEDGFLYENSHKCDFRLFSTKRGRKVDLPFNDGSVHHAQLKHLGSAGAWSPPISSANPPADFATPPEVEPRALLC